MRIDLQNLPNIDSIRENIKNNTPQYIERMDLFLIEESIVVNIRDFYRTFEKEFHGDTSAFAFIMKLIIQLLKTNKNNKKLPSKITHLILQDYTFQKNFKLFKKYINSIMYINYDFFNKHILNYLISSPKKEKYLKIMNIIPNWTDHLSSKQKYNIYIKLLKDDSELTLAYFLRDNPVYLKHFLKTNNYFSYCKNGYLAPAILTYKNKDWCFLNSKYKTIPIDKVPSWVPVDSLINTSLEETTFSLFKSKGKELKKIFLNNCLQEDYIEWNLISLIKGFLHYKINYNLVINFAKEYKRKDDLCPATAYSLATALQKIYNDKRVLNLMHLYSSNIDYSIVCDIISMINQLTEQFPNTIKKIIKKPKNFPDLHNSLSKELTIAVESAKNKKLPQKEIMFLDNQPLKNFKLYVIKNTLDLAITGRTLKHCVASYAPRIESKQSFVLNIKDNNKIKYTAEINPHDGSIVQIKGFHNENAPSYIFGELNELLKPLQPKKSLFKIKKMRSPKQVIDDFIYGMFGGF